MLPKIVTETLTLSGHQEPDGDLHTYLCAPQRGRLQPSGACKVSSHDMGLPRPPSTGGEAWHWADRGFGM